MCIFEYLGYYVFEDIALPYPYELYHNGHIVASYDNSDDAINDIPFSEYI